MLGGFKMDWFGGKINVSSGRFDHEKFRLQNVDSEAGLGKIARQINPYFIRIIFLDALYLSVVI